MLADLFEVRETENRGKGLFAKNFIPVGTIVFYEDPSEILNEEFINQMTEKERQDFLFHAYRRKDGSYFMPCDDAKFCNHSCNANILDSGLGFDVVVRDIQEGEEATYDYRVFYDNDFEMPCECGEANCCKTVSCIHPVPPSLQAFWKNRIDAALENSGNVKQTLTSNIKNLQ